MKTNMFRKLLSLFALLLWAFPALATTTPFNLDTFGIQWNSYWHTPVVSSVQVRQPMVGYGEMEFSFTGTDCSIVIQCPASTVNVVVDGGTATTLAVQSSLTTVSVASGLSDQAHTVVLYITTAGAQPAVYLQYTGGISVTGGNPAISSPAGYGTWYPMASHFVQLDGLSAQSDPTSQSQPKLTSTISGITFASFTIQTTATSLYVWGKSGGTLKVYNNTTGAFVGSTITTVAPTGSLYGWTQIATGMAGTSKSLTVYETVKTYLHGIRAVGGVLTIPPVRPTIVFIGDSITNGQGATDLSLGFAATLCRTRGASMRNPGYPGAPVLPITSGLNQIEDMGTYAGDQQPITPSISAVVVMAGINDQTVNTETEAQFTASYNGLIEKIVQGVNCPVYFVGYTPNYATNSSRRSAWNTDISNLVTTWAARGYNVTYISTDSLPWSNGSANATYMTDTKHPSDAGHAAISALLNAAMTATTASAGSTTILLSRPGRAGGRN